MAVREPKAIHVSCEPKTPTERLEALTAHDPDAAKLAHLGKRQVLKVGIEEQQLVMRPPISPF